MKRETVNAVLQLVATIRSSTEATRQIVDDEALQVGDRNIIDHSLMTIANELDVLTRTLSEMLADPTKTRD